MSAHDMTPEQVLDASIAAVNGPFARLPKDVEQGVQRAAMILGQLRWRGFDVARIAKPHSEATREGEQ
ncbi:MAG: hypothetical protein ACJ8H8_18540 [Geminicoccaceae bacterium]